MRKSDVILSTSMASANYARRAKFYDLEFSDKSDYKLLASLMSPDVTSILEIPCGSGRNCEWLARTGKDVLFGDLSPEMIDVVNAKLAYLPFHHQACAKCMDMTVFSVDRLRNLIIVPREGFQLLSKDTAVKALQACVKNMAPHGCIYLDLAVLTPDTVNQPQHLPKYIAQQSAEFMHDLAVRGPGYLFRRSHRSRFQGDVLSVTFKYQVTEDETTITYTSAFDLASYTYAELEAMAAQAHLSIEVTYGYYDKSPFTHQSARIITLLKGTA